MSTIQPAPDTEALSLDQVTLDFPGSHRPAVEDVSFKVKRGSFVAVIGPSGCGKSAPAPAAEEGSQGPYPLFPDADVLAADWYLRTRVYPLHSVIAIRSELVERDPGLPSALYAAFVESKRLHTAADPQWSALPRFAKQAGQIGGDPVPYGVTANAPSLDALVRYCADQGLYDTDGPTDPRTLFADGDYQDA
jgi:4,5-dihydroxyphthalate decarboxylase